MRKTLFLLLFMVLAIGAVFGQINIQAGQTVNQIFDTIGTTATATLPTAWKADKQTSAQLVGTYVSAVTATERIGGNSMSTTAGNGIYNFGAGIDNAATDRAIGFLSSSSATKSGNIYVQLSNNGSSAISSFNISYNVEKYRMGSNDAGFSIQMYYSSDGVTWTSAGASFLTSFTADASNNGYAPAPGATVNVSASLPQSLAAGASIYLAWNYSVTSGTTTSNSQALGVDDISIVAAGGAPTPVISAPASLTAFSTTTGTPSDIQSYTLSGSNLTAQISVGAPTGYEISTDQSNWVSGIVRPADFNGLIYVRMTGTTAGQYDGFINHTSTGATPVNTTVTGLVSDPTPTILTTGTLTAFNTVVGSPSAAQQYSLTSAFLTTNIIVAAPAGFEISTDGTTYSSGLSLVPAFTGQVYVRLTGTTAGSYSGNITHNSTGATEATVAVSGAVTTPVGPTTFLEENFPYVAGTTLVSNGWVAHNGAGTNSPIVANAGLTYPGYLPASGLAGKTIASGEDVHRTFATQTTGNVYTSFLFSPTTISTTADYPFHMGAGPIGTDFKGRFCVQADASNNLRFGITKAGVATAAVYTDYIYSLNNTYLIVIKYTINSGLTNDQVYMWVNPTISATEPAPQLTASDVTGADATNVGSVAIRQGTPVAVFDGIRVTNNWPMLWDGTPPPSPVINVTGELTPFTSTVNTPSEVIQTYTLSGSNLSGSLNVQAPSGFQLSTNGSDGWSDILTLPSTFNGTIHVRMFATIVSTFEGDIAHTSTGATQVDLHVSGESFNPAVIWHINPTTLQQFSQEAGTPSANQSYTLSATNATVNLGMAVEAPFELSTTGTGGWAGSLSLAPTFNGTIYVRMNSATAGPFSSTIVHSTADASNFDIAVSGTATAPAGNYATDLFFSEYIEGSGSNKALEIFNGTGVPVDLSMYTLKLANNAASWGTPFTLTGTLAQNDVYVITNSGAALAEIIAASDMTSTVTYYNGDDAVGLFKNDILIDIIGTIGADPGTAWPVAGVANATAEHTLIRKPTVVVGNIDWTTSAGTNADDSEWIVQAQNYAANIGSHTFNPGAPIVSTPVFTPTAGVYTTPQSVTISCATSGASIYYTTNGSEPTDASSLYGGAIPVSATTTIKAKAYKTGFTASSVATATYNFPTNVANIAALRTQPTGTTVYRLTGEAVLTFQQGATRYTKYVQDATAAIVIDDPAHIITTTYNLYDGITGITGTLGLYNQLLQFTPVADPGAATSTGNVIVPEVRTLASLTSADQAKLIKVMNVNIDPALVNFPAAASNINATDPTATRILRTFAGTDYVSTPIPTVATDIICLVGQYLTDIQISPRFLADMSPSTTGQLDSPVVTITRNGNNVVLNWNAIPGANSGYRIEVDTNPYGSFSTIYNTLPGVLTWSETTAEKKFYRVVARP